MFGGLFKYGIKYQCKLNVYWGFYPMGLFNYHIITFQTALQNTEFETCYGVTASRQISLADIDTHKQHST